MSQRYFRCCLAGVVLLICCSTIYLPFFFNFNQISYLNWTMSKDMRLYIRPDNQTALITVDHLCSDAEQLVLVIAVSSSVTNFASRQAIRETWGSISNNRSTPVRVFFILGRTPNLKEQEAVKKESELKGDILQEDFIDTYHNLSIKTVMMLKWVNTWCRNSHFIMKTDDDMYVNVPFLLRYLKQHIKDQKLLFGCLICGAVPVKDKDSKWYTPQGLFSEQVYPNYLSGTGYILSSDVARDLYWTALETPFFHLEDVYVTGICARHLKLTPRHHIGFSYQHYNFSNLCLFQHLITSHKMSPSELRTLWTKLSHDKRVCKKYKLKLSDDLMYPCKTKRTKKYLVT